VEVLVVGPEGRIVCLYSELIELRQFGRLRIRRASYVEPDRQGRWFAHILAGPSLGPFPTRSRALAAERRWLQRRLTAKVKRHKAARMQTPAAEGTESNKEQLQ